MRRLIRFPCGSDTLSGSYDHGASTTGLLCVTGGSQIRCGPHRMLHGLAATVAGSGFPVFRYERRGLGDSDGADPGYRDSGPDLIAAVAEFRAQAPHVARIVGFGLCDGATTLALHGHESGVAALALANPWLVETEDGDLAPAATRAHYRGRLLSLRGWASVLRGEVDLIGAARSAFGTLKSAGDSSLADQVAARLGPYSGKLALILAEGDGTAIAAKACWSGAGFAGVRDETVVTVPTASHTFARPEDLAPLADAVIDFVRRMDSNP